MLLYQLTYQIYYKFIICTYIAYYYPMIIFNNPIKSSRDFKTQQLKNKRNKAIFHALFILTILFILTESAFFIIHAYKLQYI